MHDPNKTDRWTLAEVRAAERKYEQDRILNVALAIVGAVGLKEIPRSRPVRTSCRTEAPEIPSRPEHSFVVNASLEVRSGSGRAFRALRDVVLVPTATPAAPTAARCNPARPTVS